MFINVIRLRSALFEKEKQSIKENDDFLEEINNELINDDITLTENNPDASFSIVFVESGGSEVEFVKVLPTLKEPIIILSNGKNNSLPASLEIKTYCSQHKYIGLLFTGDESQIADAIKDTSLVINAYNTLEGQNLGVIGHPSDWLIASQVDYQLVKDKYHLNLIDISMEEFFTEIDKKRAKDLRREYKQLLNELKQNYPSLKKEYSLRFCEITNLHFWIDYLMLKPEDYRSLED